MTPTKQITTASSINEARALVERGEHVYLDTHPSGRSGDRRIRGYVVRRQVYGVSAGTMETVVLRADGKLVATL